MSKQTITVEVPEGWDLKSVDLARDAVVDKDGVRQYYADAILHKKKPIRVTHELVSETPRRAKQHELFSPDKTGRRVNFFENEGESAGTYYIWREVKGEGDD